jgi:HSP20 family protein
MTIVRWNPFREMVAMQSAMDRLLDDAWRGARPTVSDTALMLDVHETDAEYKISTELPGVDPDKIQVSVHDGVLTISGTIEKQEEHKDARTLMQERVYGHYSRSVRLPQPVDSDNVSAEYDHGVLTLTLPKRAEAQPKLIPVRKA